MRSVLQNAFIALRKHKEAPGICWRSCNPEMNRPVVERLAHWNATDFVLRYKR